MMGSRRPATRLAWLSVLALSGASRESGAAECIAPCTADCLEWPSNTMTYSINTADIATGPATQIELAAGAWSAGVGELNAGADWSFVRGADNSIRSEKIFTVEVCP